MGVFLFLWILMIVVGCQNLLLYHFAAMHHTVIVVDPDTNNAMMSAPVRVAPTTTTTTTTTTAYHAVDLRLPQDKIPAVFWFDEYDLTPSIEEILNEPDTTNDYSENDVSSSETWSNFLHHKNKRQASGKTFALGIPSSDYMTHHGELGLLDGVKKAWENHWNLRTCPEDWWFTVARRIAKAIDQAAKATAQKGDQRIRQHFVSHAAGKEKIAINVSKFFIYDVDYDPLFENISSQLEGRIKVPQFARSMQSDFSTTTPTQRIASQINLMASMQEFFEYEINLVGCGLKGLEMAGTQADWDYLLVKLQQVEEQLQPIISSLDLDFSWFRHIEYVFHHLAETYANPDSANVHDFWADVLMIGKDWKYGLCGTRQEADSYNGWLIPFLLGEDKVFPEDLSFNQTIREQLNGLNTVPVMLSFAYLDPVVKDEAELKAGILGYTIVAPEDTFNQVPSVELTHMFAMMLPENSPLRSRDFADLKRRLGPNYVWNYW